MSAEIASTFFTVAYAQTLAQSMEQNQVDVLVLTPHQYMSILQDKAKNHPRLEFALRQILGNSSFGRYWSQTFSPNASEPWVGPVAQGANDLIMITKTLNALGMSGITSYVKYSKGKTYIIIKGYAARRSSALQGTRYLASHPKMLQLGLGMKSLQGVAKGGFMLGVVVSSGIEVTDFIFNDEKTMYDLVGGIGVEAVKGGLAALVAYALAALVGMTTGIAVVPLLTTAVAAFVGGWALNELDARYKVKTQVIAALKAVPEQTALGIYYIDTKSQSWIEQAKSLIDNKKIEVSRGIDQGMKQWLCRIQCRLY